MQLFLQGTEGYNPKPASRVIKLISILRENGNNRGQLVVSHRKARLSKSWDKINGVFNNNETIKIYVKCCTKGGYDRGRLGHGSVPAWFSVRHR